MPIRSENRIARALPASLLGDVERQPGGRLPAFCGSRSGWLVPLLILSGMCAVWDRIATVGQAQSNPLPMLQKQYQERNPRHYDYGRSGRSSRSHSGYSGHGHRHRPFWGGIGTSYHAWYGPNFGYPLVPGYGWGSYWGPQYGIYYDTYTGISNYVLPPVAMPAELLYGPGPVNRMFGGGAFVAPPRQTILVSKPSPPSNPETLKRAERFLEFGDRLYQEQRYHEALQRYKSAAEAAPDLAEAHFRQAHALAATHRNDLAVKAFQVAVRLADSIERNGFRLDQLYGDNHAAKENNLELLAQDALKNPEDPQAMFLVATFLYYDGQLDRSRIFFQKAQESAAGDDEHILPYLDATRPKQELDL